MTVVGRGAQWGEVPAYAGMTVKGRVTDARGWRASAGGAL